MGRKIKTGVLQRSVNCSARAIDADARTVEVSFSSETPVSRWGANEILDHGRGAVDLGRLTSGAAVLFNHNIDHVVGVVEKARIDRTARVGRAVLRFGDHERGEECFRLIADEILSKISVGYAVHRMEHEKHDSEGPDTYRVTRWEPYEISIVTMPADNSVGVGRTDDMGSFLTRTTNRFEIDTEIEEVQPMNDKTRGAEGATTVVEPATAAPAAQVVTDTRQAAPPPAAPAEIPGAVSQAKRQVQMQKEILAIGKAADMLPLALEYIEADKTVDEFRNAVIEAQAARLQSTPIEHETPTLGLSQREIKRYSIMNVINVLAEPANPRMHEAAAFELECSRAVADLEGVAAPKGIYLTDAAADFGYNMRQVSDSGVLHGAKVPADIMRHQSRMHSAALVQLLLRDLTAGTATDGAELVATNLLAGSFIDVLRNLMVVMGAGATRLGDLRGDVAIPRKTSGAAGGWINPENTDASESDPQFDQVTMTPRTVGAFTEISRQLRLQSSLDVEALVREDLAMALALAIDLGALYGSGAAGQPTGVSNQAGINTPTNFAAQNPTFAEVVAMETPVATGNALMGALAYICRADMRGSLKTTLKSAGVAGYIWEPGDQLNGYPAFSTSQVTSGDLFFGNWRDVLIGLWAGLDILLDPYTGSAAGRTRIVAHQSVDVAIRHGASFSFNNDGV